MLNDEEIKRAMKCIVCHERKATVPDRNTMSQKPRLCADCHAERLRGDFKFILDAVSRKRERGEKP